MKSTQATEYRIISSWACRQVTGTYYDDALFIITEIRRLRNNRMQNVAHNKLLFITSTCWDQTYGIVLKLRQNSPAKCKVFVEIGLVF